jgi:hypothetical protein
METFGHGIKESIVIGVIQFTFYKLNYLARLVKILAGPRSITPSSNVSNRSAYHSRCGLQDVIADWPRQLLGADELSVL